MRLGVFASSPPVHVEGEFCPDCGLESIVTFPISNLSGEGVDEVGSFRGCIYCWPKKHGRGD